MNLERASTLTDNTLEDFATGANTSISLDLGLLAIKALVNTVTLVISAEVGMKAPLVGHRVLAFVRGNLRDGPKSEVDGSLAKGSVTFYLDGEELWVLMNLRFSSPFFPAVNEAFKVAKLGGPEIIVISSVYSSKDDTIYSPPADLGDRKALNYGENSSIS
ncbi:unnamed protein product [Rhizoctonia solani]|uniref:Uncharacterized protein n=1 Tax=Rhizoctonia solani TaxID=456999 RepID=A0A8H3GB22_9AGAM|nr:unnamed protein product [Rhizoctonia solani]